MEERLKFITNLGKHEVLFLLELAQLAKGHLSVMDEFTKRCGTLGADTLGKVLDGYSLVDRDYIP